MLPFPCRIRYLIRGEHQIALFVAVVLRYAQFIPAGAADIERVFIPLLSGGGLENAPRTLFAPRPVPPDPHRDRAALEIELILRRIGQLRAALQPYRFAEPAVDELQLLRAHRSAVRGGRLGGTVHRRVQDQTVRDSGAGRCTDCRQHGGAIPFPTVHFHLSTSKPDSRCCS